MAFHSASSVCVVPIRTNARGAPDRVGRDATHRHRLLVTDHLADTAQRDDDEVVVGHRHAHHDGAPLTPPHCGRRRWLPSMRSIV